MAPLGMKLEAPNKVSLYLMGDNILILENFNDNPVDVNLEMTKVSELKPKIIIPALGKATVSKSNNTFIIKELSSRTLVAFEYK